MNTLDQLLDAMGVPPAGTVQARCKDLTGEMKKADDIMLLGNHILQIDKAVSDIKKLTTKVKTEFPNCPFNVDTLVSELFAKQ